MQIKFQTKCIQVDHHPIENKINIIAFSFVIWSNWWHSLTASCNCNANQTNKRIVNRNFGGFKRCYIGFCSKVLHNFPIGRNMRLSETYPINVVKLHSYARGALWNFFSQTLKPTNRYALMFKSSKHINKQFAHTNQLHHVIEHKRKHRNHAINFVNS